MKKALENIAIVIISVVVLTILVGLIIGGWYLKLKFIKWGLGL